MAKAVIRQVLLRVALAVPILFVVTLFTFVIQVEVGDPASVLSEAPKLRRAAAAL